MSNELAIPQEPLSVYHDDDWQPIANIFATYKEKLQTIHDHAKDCLLTALDWRKNRDDPKAKPTFVKPLFNLLSNRLETYDLLPDLRTDIPAHIDEIISELDSIRIACLPHIKGQEEAIDATRRFHRACTILQDLHSHGISTRTPENLLKKFKDDLDQIALDFNDDTIGFQEGTAINLAEAFCRGTYQIEDWLLQHVYNATCYHNRLVPTINAPSIDKKIDDVKSSILGISSKIDAIPSKINPKKVSRKPSNTIYFDQAESIMNTQCPRYAVGEREIRRWIKQGHTTRGNFPITWDNLASREAWIKWCRDYRWHMATKGGSEAIPPNLIHRKY